LKVVVHSIEGNRLPYFLSCPSSEFPEKMNKVWQGLHQFRTKMTS